MAAMNAVAEEIEGLRFNRAIAAVYEFANALTAAPISQTFRQSRDRVVMARSSAALVSTSAPTPT